jgi:hypothetical protein
MGPSALLPIRRKVSPTGTASRPARSEFKDRDIFLASITSNIKCIRYNSKEHRTHKYTLLTAFKSGFLKATVLHAKLKLRN